METGEMGVDEMGPNHLRLFTGDKKMAATSKYILDFSFLIVLMLYRKTYNMS